MQSKEQVEKTILGIDPGSNIMGIGIIRANGSNSAKLLAMDILKLSGYKSSSLKLKQIFQSVSRLIETFEPDEVALEAPFFGKNVQSMLKLGRAQGMAMAPAIIKEIPVFEYSPKEIKQSITGNGNATKEQVAEMLKLQIDFGKMPKHLDATDALATALCHMFRSQKKGSDTSYKGWKSFLDQNPDRVK